LEEEMTESFAMYSDFGDRMVGVIVAGAKEKGLCWAEVLEMLRALSTIEGCREATDTEVRETVYDAIGAYHRGEDFWV
jgi:hypothetical protein